MADPVNEKQIRAEQIRDIIMQKLAETGEKDILKDVLRDRLINSGELHSSSTSDKFRLFISDL